MIIIINTNVNKLQTECNPAFLLTTNNILHDSINTTHKSQTLNKTRD